MTKPRVARLASELRRLKNERGWTFKQMQDITDIPGPTLYNLLGGHTQKPDYDNLDKLTLLPGVEWEQIIDWLGYDWRKDVREAAPAVVPLADTAAAPLLRTIAERAPELESCPSIVEEVDKYIRFLTSGVNGAPNAAIPARTRNRRTRD